MRPWPWPEAVPPKWRHRGADQGLDVGARGGESGGDLQHVLGSQNLVTEIGRLHVGNGHEGQHQRDGADRK